MTPSDRTQQERRLQALLADFQSLESAPSLPTPVSLAGHHKQPAQPPSSLAALERDASAAQEDRWWSDTEDASLVDQSWQEVDPALRPAIEEEVEELLGQLAQGLPRWSSLDANERAEIRRALHTMKSTVSQAGALRARRVVHRLETAVDDPSVSDTDLVAGLAWVERLLYAIRSPVKPSPAPVYGSTFPVTPSPTATASDSVRNVRMSAGRMDRLIAESNESRLLQGDLVSRTRALRAYYQDLTQGVSRLSRLARDLEVASERGQEIRRHSMTSAPDLLDLDRYTDLQELSRALNEMVGDFSDLSGGLSILLSDTEALLQHQSLSLQEIQTGLNQTRLHPVNKVLSRLSKVVDDAGRELGKSVRFDLEGGAVALDRVLLEGLVPVLEHVLRNAVVHGLETPAQRSAAGKPATGRIRMMVKQEAHRLHWVIEDDGAGLSIQRVHRRAVELGLWQRDHHMSNEQAADMVTRPGFSTAGQVSEMAGRGVGMDVVRNKVLALGGRFDLVSRPGQGLVVHLQMPSVVATAPVLIATAARRRWAIPIELVEDVARWDPEPARMMWRPPGQTKETKVIGLASLLAFPSDQVAQEHSMLLILREGLRRLVVSVEAVTQVQAVPLRPLHRVWGDIPGVIGATLLSDGMAAFIVDPMRVSPVAIEAASLSSQHGRRARVLVVDDSTTVRKVSTGLLERNGFETAQARDGQEAIEKVASYRPDIVLLDVEMPRMDGFDCARHLRERYDAKALPIVMITTRLARKHREKAWSLGVNEYMGKPFKEEALLAIVRRYTAHVTSPATPTPATPTPAI